MFGPLGLSFAPYVRSSRYIYNWIKPIATWYANLAGYRKMGFKYDDLREHPLSHGLGARSHDILSSSD
jgi:Ubiquinol-cytochrome C reductase complex 14kD subunit